MINKRRNIIVIIAVIFILAVISIVLVRNRSKNLLKIDVSKIELNVEMERFDLDIQNVMDGDPYTNVHNIEEKYGDFFDLYNTSIIGIGGVENLSYFTYLSTFLNDYSVVEATKEIGKVFPDVDQINKDLTYGFKHFKFYFPDSEIPRIISFVAGFNQSVITYEDYVGIGLDKYLGSDCYLYDMLNIPAYAKAEMTKEQIPIDIMTALAKLEFEYIPETENLLNQMIYNGKILYFIDAMFPEFEEARKNKYTYGQLEFCKGYERDMWTNLIENKLLFVTDYLTIRKFTEDAPFTYQFGPDSPPRVGNWIGLQIVRSYMKHNKDISLHQLMEDNNYQKILNLSQYSPK